MASEAEVDLIISTAGTLPELERDLNNIIRAAENGAPELDVEAALAVGASLANLAGELDQVVTLAEEGADNIELSAALDAQRSLAHVQGQLESLIQRASQGDDINLQAELDQIGSLTGISNQIRSLVREVEASAPEIDLHVDVDRDGRGERSALRLGRAFTSALGPIGKFAGGIGAVGLASSSAAPLLASVVTSLQAIAPAAALGVSAVTTLGLVGATTTVAFQGMGDAIEASFDPDAKPKDLAKAMEKLAPAARSFVTELRGMGSQFKAIRQDVQGGFFEGLDTSLNDLGTNVLPTVATAMRSTAGVLNQMARGAALAAVDLGKDGTLGRALDSSVASLGNLNKLPAQFVRGMGQIAAAAGPSLERVSKAAGSAGDRIAKKLETAFQSGAMERAINSAVDAIGQLGRIGANVFQGLGNIISTFSDASGGLFGTLEKITQAFADVTATKGFQDALIALSTTMSVLVNVALPLVSQALQLLGPIFTTLAPPIQELIMILGDGLGQILTALGPALVSLAQVFGKLVVLITPFVTLAANLVAAILPALTPLFDALGQALTNMAPFVQQLASTLSATLVPLFTTLATQVLPQLLPPLVQLTSAIFPVMTQLLTALGPSLVQLAAAFGNVLVALTPVLVELTNLTIKLGQELAPILEPLIALILKLVTGALGILVAQLNGVVVPALRILVDLLQGDFSAAFEGAQALVSSVWNKIVEVTSSLVGSIGARLRQLVIDVGARVTELTERAVQGFQEMVRRAVAEVSKLPGQITTGLGNLGSLLFNAGADVVRGFINGLSSQLGRLRDKASEIAGAVSGSVKDFLGIQSPSRLMMEVGADTMEGFRLGIAGSIPNLRRELQGVASMAPSFALPSGQRLTLPAPNMGAPTVQVYLGNELLNAHVDTRIARSNQARDRLAVRGVRR